MQPDVQALVALQAEDAAIFDLERRLQALEPPLLDLERQLQVARDAHARAVQAVESEERRRREIQERVAQSRSLQERSRSQLDAVTNVREATAAMAQADQTRRMAAEGEGELHIADRRLEQLRETVAQAEAAVAQIEQEQEAKRTEIATRRRELEDEMRHAHMKRDGTASRVSLPLLAKYDRIRRRSGPRAVFPLRGGSCGHCDTTIPVQRRREMERSGAVEMCEACGVLLYAPE